MKKTELEQKLSEINEKIGSLESFNERVTKAQSLIQSLESSVTALEQKKSGIDQFHGQISEIKQAVENAKLVVEQAVETAQPHELKLKEQEEAIGALKKKIEELKGETEELENTANIQLGRISSQVLANSFNGEVGKLEVSVSSWFKRLTWSIVGLLFVSAVIVGIQFTREETLLSLNFLIKASLTTPLIYFLYFANHQYNREKRLLEEYRFKAAIALSFEAYRKLIREEITDLSISEEKKQERIIDFIVSSVRSIYSSPMRNIALEHVQDETDIQEIVKATLPELTKSKDV